MKTEIRKWGNSLAIRIPRAFVQETHLGNGSKVDLKVRAGRLVISPLPGKRYRLRALLARMRRSNRPSETQWGGPAGKEVW
jgi:antitoxin MazE